VTIPADTFKGALSRFPTGVCVVTSVAGDGRLCGITISAFTSVSLEPPLILFCLGRKNEALIRDARGDHFAVNVLADDQGDVSESFASQKADKFEGIAHKPGVNGCPLLSDCLLSLECSLFSVYEGGDHLIVVGRVSRIHPRGGNPLLRYRGRYLSLTS
jgi:flavin reductase (DIM6/NTAB) family NADH-FMN oxidoreductase RutF